MSNRERKYRAWNKVTKTMLYDTKTEENTDFPFIAPNGKIFGFYISEGGGDLVHIYDVFDIMDWTGLKDKNGKEIFEGDILSAKRTVTGMPLPNGKCAEVFGPSPVGYETRTWDEIIFAEILVTENSIGFMLPKEGGTYQERGKPLQWEIIGNIYEHPELIESK